MKTAKFSMLFAGIARAHFAPKELIIDGNKYPARDARLDDYVGAMRIEWSYTDNQNFTWMALNDVESQGIACGNNPEAPPLKAVARAGADITIQWTEMVEHHWGPSMTYLGAWSPGQSPQSVDFFKINDKGYDASQRLWANELIINNGFRDQLKLPSDIKPGLYILRTELLSLHGNGQTMNPGLKGLPQFYTHCFNVEITGNGSVIPPGVRFPGGYAKNDPGVTFVLGTTSRYPSYPVPGPPVYEGAYDPPVGPKPVVTPEEVGTFPPNFELQYQALLKQITAFSDKAVDFFNGGGFSLTFFSRHEAEGKELVKQRAELRQEAIKLGLADPNEEMQNSEIF
ncbi:hypothetical protein P152DRAFT_475360 [Eremomyces bilateralis CBS 781.70]|uniref:lytic cellulose monooxygenase (C4-dehydrogenating) n=1 Tax=Eremomyces bilateralis CBS 781.70 TaxID=1392243 RepID=A0A6G1FZD1_9PEZI|nr:uncharacterized protein P152DRAFT_475360 [Eremomyces bilateralis CBS 781.70]KAF1810919.1 hypothetical protein P152DRAFT_475360 [Eremomyces bilateralis CBS 781.70]